MYYIIFYIDEFKSLTTNGSIIFNNTVFSNDHSASQYYIGHNLGSLTNFDLCPDDRMRAYGNVLLYTIAIYMITLLAKKALLSYLRSWRVYIVLISIQENKF